MTTTSRPQTPPTEVVPGADLDPAKVPGHWLLARMGKRVLRPGGRAMTDAMLAGLAIGPDDDVVEFAPGMGATTRLVMERRPKSYTGVERDPEAATTVRSIVRAGTDRVEEATVQANGLADGSASVVFGEAYLTMQSEEHKRQIVGEAFRILRPGGRFGLHEMSLRPDSISPAAADEVRRDLSHSIHVGARPITVAAWREVLESVGFEVTLQRDASMGLLHPRRVVADEGWARALKIGFNVARNRAARKRILAMRATFQRHADDMGSIALVARRPAE